MESPAFSKVTRDFQVPNLKLRGPDFQNHPQRISGWAPEITALLKMMTYISIICCCSVTFTSCEMLSNAVKILVIGQCAQVDASDY